MWHIASRLSQIKYRFIVLIAVPILFELVFVTVLVQLLEQSEREMHRQDRARSVVAAANTLSRVYYNTGIMLGAWGVSEMNPLLRLSYHRNLNDIAPSLEKLHVLVSDNPRQLKLFDQLSKRSDEYVRELASAEQDKLYLHSDESYPAVRARFEGFIAVVQEQMAQLNGDLKELTQEEADLENQSLQEKSRSRNAFKAAVAAGVALNIILAAVLAVVFNRTIQKRFEILMDNSMRLGRGDSLQPPLGGKDEIAELDNCFRDMAAALEEARNKERAVIDNAQDVICSIDASGRFSEVSPAAKTLWGYSPADLLGTRWIDLIAPDDKAFTQQVIKEMMREGTSVPIENRLIIKGGSMMDVLWSTRWSKQENSLFCVIHDITQRKRAESLLKESEERARSVIENIPTGIITVAADGLIESINPAAASIFKCDQSDLNGKDATVLFSADSGISGSALTVIQSLGATKSGALERECTRLNGSRFPAEISATDYRTLNGNHFLLHIQDITERREIEQLKQEFVAMVSHDLRTPLTAVLGVLTLLGKETYGTLSERGLRSVNNGILNVERLINLINDLLDMEKLEHGSMSLAPSPIKVERVIDRAIDSVKAYAEQQHVTLCNALPQASADRLVMADEDRLVQVLVNLLSNAIKFSPDNGKVEVSATFADGKCKVTVEDQGRGVPENLREAIFERFRQVEASDGTRGKGTGLGLAICKKIIDCHNGETGVESNNGSGSSFWFTVPQA